MSRLFFQAVTPSCLVLSESLGRGDDEAGWGAVLHYLPNAVCTWNPNDPCFDWKRPCFGGLTFKNRGHLGSRYISIQLCNRYMFSYDRFGLVRSRRSTYLDMIIEYVRTILVSRSG